MGETVWSLTEAARKDLLSKRERRALLDALGHSPDCVAPDHYRKVWQEEREARARAEAALRSYGVHHGGMDPRPNGDGCVLTKGGTWCSCGLSAALSADADTDAESEQCSECGGFGAVPSGLAKGTLLNCTRCHGTGEGGHRAEGDEPDPFKCQRCTVPIAYIGHHGDLETHVAPGLDPSRNREAVEANADHDPLPETRDAEGGRPREADPQGTPSGNGDASVDGEGDDGRSRAIDRLCDRCGHRRDVHEFPNYGRCQAVNGACACPGVPRREPSRLERDS